MRKTTANQHGDFIWYEIPGGEFQLKAIDQGAHFALVGPRV